MFGLSRDCVSGLRCLHSDLFLEIALDGCRYFVASDLEEVPTAILFPETSLVVCRVGDVVELEDKMLSSYGSSDREGRRVRSPSILA